MAGTLVIDTLNASSGVLAARNGMTGIAKAWCTFNGKGSVTNITSFNVSSITLGGDGSGTPYVYTINFTTPMPTANYVAVASGNNLASGSMRGIVSPITYNTNYVTISAWAGSNTTRYPYYIAGYTDMLDLANVAIFGA